ncbi:glycosyltransferase [Thalassomonas sp. M1454]|uniref:glycosyltransferase n=1 Tax=Thalassomonas sp. M1454 TaxID=2594477 RepID=UPI00117F5890|nr:glycosyltransferase [Thalassomonas sp. M1454]TRX57933.1 glycosyltransferase family 4 protein [Thalassomonas sp. M1454]
MAKKIKVLEFICPTGFYGAERWILALVNNNKAQNINYELAVTLEQNSQNLELVKQFKKYSEHTHEIPMSNKFDLSVINKLVRLIKNRGIDIIHSHGYKSDILAVIVAKKAGIKVVVTPHGFENVDDLKLKTFIWLGCHMMRFADKVVPLSKQLVLDVKRYGITKPKLEYIQNGVDLSEVEQQRTKAKAATSKVKNIGFVGQMISRKNIQDLLNIFDSLFQTDPNIRLTLLGDGELRKDLEQYSQTLKSKDCIDFLGFRDDRLALLQQFDLFVMTSSLEGIPRCLMEAMAMEIPVAAYDIKGIDQLITHQQTGLLSNFGDKADLQLQWQKLLNDKSYAQTLAKNAKDFVYKHYSAQRMAAEYQQLFESMLMDK